jgi:hypothetical protein
MYSKYMKELIFTPEEEKVDEGFLIEGLKTRGFKDVGIQELLFAWAIEREKLIDKALDRNEALIKIDIERADLYIAASKTESALASLEIALELAFETHHDELYLEIEERIKQLKTE